MNPMEPPHPKQPLLLWAALIFLVATIAVLQRTARDSPEPKGAPGPNIEMQFMAKYAMGAHLQSETWLPSTSQTSDALLTNLRARAESTYDQLRLAIITAELSNREQALFLLEKLETESQLEGSVVGDIKHLTAIYNMQPGTYSQEEHKGLVQRHGWFGELAVSYGLPDWEPHRRSVIASANRTFFAIIVAVIGGLAMVLLGFMLAAGVVIAHFSGRGPQARFQDPAFADPRHNAFLETVVLFFFTFLAVPLVMRTLGIGLGFFASVILLAVPLWLKLRGLSWTEMRASLGLVSGQGLIKETLCGFAGYLVGIPVLCGGLVITLVLTQISGSQPAHPIVFEFSGAGPLKLAGLFFMACIMAPVMEEILFRGVFYHYLRRRWSALVSGILTGLIFAVIHPQGLEAVPVLAALGFNFAMIREWRHSLIGPMVAHGFNNFAILCLATVIFH